MLQLLLRVEPAVGELHERVELGRFLRTLRNSVRQGRARAFDTLGVAHSKEQRLHEVGLGVRKDHRKLVASDPARIVAEAQRPTEAFAEIAKYRITGLVALLVVDGLEVVEVE